MAQIEETTVKQLAAKLERGEPLTTLETKAVIAILLDYARQLEARRRGGQKSDSSRAGRRPSENPSKHALYQRERRRKLRGG